MCGTTKTPGAHLYRVLSGVDPREQTGLKFEDVAMRSSPVKFYDWKKEKTFQIQRTRPNQTKTRRPGDLSEEDLGPLKWFTSHGLGPSGGLHSDPRAHAGSRSNSMPKKCKRCRLLSENVFLYFIYCNYEGFFFFYIIPAETCSRIK